MAADTKKCAHPSCSCTPPEGKKFCSEYCEDAKNVTALGCDCGHPSCTGEKI